MLNQEALEDSDIGFGEEESSQSQIGKKKKKKKKAAVTDLGGDSSLNSGNMSGVRRKTRKVKVLAI